MKRSTSSGDSTPASVTTCTCTLVMSGMASMGILRAATTPATAIRPTKARMRKRLFSEKSIRPDSTASGPQGFFSVRSAGFMLEQQFRFEDEHALIDDTLAFFQTRGDFHPVGRFQAGRDIHAVKGVGSVGNKDELDLLVLEDGAGRHGQDALRLAHGDGHPGEHAGAEMSFGIRDFSDD